MHYEPEHTPRGWRLTIGTLVLEVEGARYDRGAIRATLTIKLGESIAYRTITNLTSQRVRARLVADLAAKGITLDERALIALDEACRRGVPSRSPECGDGGTDVSETVPCSLAELVATFQRYLLITDPDYLPVFTGAVLAHRCASEPVWLLVVAPPGGTKTETIRSLHGYPGIYPLSELTARTFASGLETHDGTDPSLLARLRDEILTLKDFTTVLEMHREERQAILAQLREIYDGRFDKVWGTGRELHWEGRLGFLAGVTPIIDEHQVAMAVMGERFVLFRLRTPDRRQVARRALEGASREAEMRAELRRAMHGFLASRRSELPAVSDAVLDALARAADFVTRARSGVVRDGYRREFNYAPEPEVPTRFAKVLLALARGIALAYDHPAVGEVELRLVMRVALDCLPKVRHSVVTALVEHGIVADDDGFPTTSAIAGATQFSTATIRRALEDLQALGLVIVHKTGQGKADRWELKPEWAEVFEDLRAASADDVCDRGSDVSETVRTPNGRGTVSETSEGRHAWDTLENVQTSDADGAPDGAAPVAGPGAGDALEGRVLALLAHYGALYGARVAEHIGVPFAELQPLLERLVREGKVRGNHHQHVFAHTLLVSVTAEAAATGPLFTEAPQ